MMRVLAFTLVLVLAAPASAQTVQPMERLLADYPLGAAPTRMDEISRTESASVHFVQTRTEIPANYHLEHDELVFLWRGSGTVVIAGAPATMTAGTWVQVPRRTTHAFRADASGPAVALIVFTPAFDGKDRVLAPATAAAAPGAPPGAPAAPPPATPTAAAISELNLALEAYAGGPAGGDPALRSALKAFPLVDLPAGSTYAMVRMEGGGSAVVVKAELRKGAWAIIKATLSAPWAAYTRDDATDLREVARAKLGDGAARLPRVRGPWSAATLVEVKWDAGKLEGILFKKRGGAWTLIE